MDAPPRRNMTKEAIEQLRPLVATLEQQLAALQSHRADELQKNGDRKRVRRDAWKSIAERQLVQRRRVELEKQTLVDLLADQTATIHKLQRLFMAHQNRLRSAMNQGILTPSHPLSSSIFTSGPASLETLHSLTLALSRMHTHTDAILADARFLSPETSCVEIKTEHAALDTRGLAVQLIDTRVVPFPMARTADAVWLNLLNRANQKPAEPFVKDIIQSQFITHVPGFHGDVEAAMALQQVVEPDRVVMVRCSVFAYKNTEEDIDKAVVASGPPMTLHHFLWTAVSRVQDTEGGDDECQIQTCFISVPNLHGDNSNQTAAITKLCADVSRCFNADAHNEVDNFLLSGATAIGSL